MNPVKCATNPLRVAGLVLAGGQSRRFGSDKAIALLHGRPLLAWSLAALDACCERAAVSATPSGGAETLARTMGRKVLHDDPSHPRGPLAGLAAGLAWAASEGFDALATLPCDTPAVDADQMKALIAALGEADAAYAMTDAGPQGLCAVWRVRVGSMLTARLAGGDHPPVRRFLADLDARGVMFADPTIFRNANTPGDLASLD
jgi:molybdopterin-guanine dinucleotide biosynthesis protein A